MYIAFLLATGILIGTGFVLALQWVLKRERKREVETAVNDFFSSFWNGADR